MTIEEARDAEKKEEKNNFGFFFPFLFVVPSSLTRMHRGVITRLRDALLVNRMDQNRRVKMAQIMKRRIDTLAKST